MKNKIIVAIISVAFFAGALTILALPNEVSFQVQQLLNINPVNAPPLEAFATSNLLNIQVAPSNNFIHSQSYYGISFTVPNDSTPAKTLEIQFPAGFDLTNTISIILPGFGGETFSVSGQKILLTLPMDEPWTNDLVQMSLGGIVNPSTLNNKISIDIKNSGGTIIFGPTLSPVFTLSGIKSSMINSGAVTTSKISNGAVTLAKLSKGTIQTPIILSTSGCSCPSESIDFYIGSYLGQNGDSVGPAIVIPINGTLNSFYAKLENSPSGPAPTNMTVTIDGVDQALSCSIGTSSTQCNDLNSAHNISVIAGQKLSIHLKADGLIGAATASVVLSQP